MATKKYMDDNALTYYHSKVKALLNGKVDKETGKGLSTNDFTDALKTKYDNAATKVDQIIETGGEPNVIETVKVNGTALTPDANKAVDVTVPTKTSDLTNDSNFVVDASYVHTDNNFTTTLKNKLTNIAAGAEVNVQSDWSVTDTASDAFIKNKPTIPTVNNATLTIQKNGTTVKTFSANASSNVTANITVPTNNNELTNGAGYQTASEVQSAINDALEDVTGIDFQVVTSLPATGTKGVIYLVSHSHGTGDVYDEYIWLSASSSFEKIGSTDIDLSGYVLSSDLVAISNAEIDTIVA